MLSEPDGDRLHYAVRRDRELWLYTTTLAGVRMGEITRTIAETRARAGDLRQRNLPRGFTLTLILSSAVVWTLSLAAVFYLPIRISRPIQQLTAGLGQVAAGRFETRLRPTSRDEIGKAVEAFNETAGQLEQYRDRLVYLTQLASWQLLARKMAHELKNSLTPVRLNVEEIAARQSSTDPEFFQRATAIVVDEVTSLERRVRAFSEFASEPEARPARLDLDALAPGVPFISAQVGDRQLLLGDPPAGLLAIPGDASDLARCILNVLTDPALAEDLRRRGIERARLYSWTNLTGELSSVLAKYDPRVRL